MFASGKSFLRFLLLSGSIGVSASAQAQEFPTHFLRLIVPFAAGGPVDIIGRIAAKELGDELGQNVIVENRPGGSGSLGTEQAIKAAPDGYTLLLGSTSTISILPAFQKVQYNPDRDLLPLGLVATGVHIFVVNPQVPVNNVKELIAYAKAQPAPLAAGSGGNGTPDDLALHLFERETGVKLQHIQYRGTGPAVLDVVAGHVPLVAADVSAVAGFIKSGQLKALGIASPQRSVLAPQIPTMEEQGLTGIQSGGWFGLFAPAGTPPAVVKYLSDKLEIAMKRPEARDRVFKAGVTPLALNASEATARVKKETEKWGQLITQNNIQSE